MVRGYLQVVPKIQPMRGRAITSDTRIQMDCFAVAALGLDDLRGTRLVVQSLCDLGLVGRGPL